MISGSSFQVWFVLVTPLVEFKILAAKSSLTSGLGNVLRARTKDRRERERVREGEEERE